MRLARGILWNALGIGLPMVVGVVVVPAIVRGLGTERFGFLSIVWMMIGYFSIFDLGLGRTLTKLVADRLGARREEEVPPLLSTTVVIVVATSVVASAALALSAGWLAQHIMGNAPALVPEATAAIMGLAAGLPFVLLATVLVGLLEGYQAFGWINAVRLPFGIAVLVLPLAVLPFSKDLGVITAAVAALRVLNAVVLGWLTLRLVPGLRRGGFSYRRELVRPLLTFGGWLTVSNVVGPLMVYFDRFVIAAMLGSMAIAYYTVPYDVLNRVLLLPQAVQSVLFPSFALMWAQGSARLVSVFSRASLSTLILLAPVLLAVMLFANEGLQLWVGASFAQNSAATARILVVGVVFNAMARVPFVLVQGIGRARWTAILHLAELPFYAVVLWSVLRGGWGIEGAAYAWTGRIILDTVVLYAMSARLDPRLLRASWRDCGLAAAACLVALLLHLAVASVWVRAALFLLVSIPCGLVLLSQVTSARPSLAQGGS